MSEHYPHVRIRAQHGEIIIRDGLSVCFYMRRPHREVASAVMQSLETYVRAIGRDALKWYPDLEGEWQELDAKGWDIAHREFLDDRWANILLRDGPGGVGEFQFQYHGAWLDSPESRRKPGCHVSVVSFWLSTEFLEKHGPGAVRALAMELAAPLPFNSGHAGLSFNAWVGLPGITKRIRQLAFRHPGMDIPDEYDFRNDIGTRIRGVSWLTFLGQPVLGELGSVAGLRARLHSPETNVQEMEGGRAVVTLGRWPEAGDTEQGRDLPAYRELARVLEPWLFHEDARHNDEFPEEELRRWERRFLD